MEGQAPRTLIVSCDGTWNGRDDYGRPAAAGSYFLRLEVSGHSPQVRRVVLLR